MSITERENARSMLRYVVAPCSEHSTQTAEIVEKALDIEEAIAYENEAIQTLKPTDDERFSRLNILSLLLHTRFARYHDHKDLALAITYRRRYLSAPNLDSSHKALARLELGKLFHSLYHHSRIEEDITRAIRSCKASLELMPAFELKFTSLRALAQRELGLLYACRYADVHKESDLRKSFRHLRDCVRTMATTDPERGPSLTYTIHVLLWHFNKFGNTDGIDYLDDAVNYQKEAIDVVGVYTASITTDSDHNHARSSALDIFAELLRQRFEFTGVSEYIKDATDRAKDALGLTPKTCHLYPQHLTRYVNCLITRFRAFGDLDDINEAYKLHQQLETDPEYHAQPQFLHSLGSVWITAFEWFEKPMFLERAISILKIAVSNYLDGDTPYRAELLHDLGRALSMRFELSSLPRDIEEAISRQNDAVSRTLQNDDRRAARLLALGASLGLRYKLNGDSKDIDLAIKHQEKVNGLLQRRTHLRVQAMYELAHSLLRRYKNLHTGSDRSRAIELLREAARAPYGLPHDCLNAALLWASVLHKEGHECKDANALALALEGYQEAITRILPRVAWIGLSVTSRLVMLQSVPKALASDAASCAFSLAELTGNNFHRHIENAVELLDWGRSVMWSQAAQFRTELNFLHSKHPDLAEPLQEIAEKLDATGLDDAGQRGRHNLAKQWEDLSTRVRFQPGFEHFNLPLPFVDLRRAAHGGHVFMVNVSDFRCDGLIIMEDGQVELIPLTRLTADRVKWLVHDFAESMSIPNGARQLRGVLYDLWDRIAEPMLGRLGLLSGFATGPNPSIPRIRWCMTGQLAFLPIHAAYPRPKRNPSGKLDKMPGVLDYVVSTYIPTLSALIRADNLRRDERFSMLAVTHSEVQGYTPLHCAEDEVQILKTLPMSDNFTFLANTEATVNAVKSALQDSTWVHFACHGQQHPIQPMQSSLILHDGPLYVSKIAERSVAGDFAMLLACESAKGSSGFSDEAIHIAAGLHFAGFRSVIATMLSIRDDYGPIVAEKVYEHVFRKRENGTVKPDSSEAAFALRQALLFLRDVKKAPIREWCPFIHFGI